MLSKDEKLKNYVDKQLLNDANALPRAYRERYSHNYMQYSASGQQIGHSCRRCKTVIQSLVKLPDGREQLFPLDNYRLVRFQLENGGFYTTNMCADCARLVDTKDVNELKALLISDRAAWARADQLAGLNKEEHLNRVQRMGDLRVKRGCRKDLISGRGVKVNP